MGEFTGNIEYIESDAYRLLFSVLKSGRYHHRRVQFFDRLRACVIGLTVLSGAGTIVAVLVDADSGWVTTFAVLTAMFTIFELFVGSVRTARVHYEFARQFIGLEQAIRDAHDRLSRGQMHAFQSRLCEILTQEPPRLKVLDAMCHNEVLQALGKNRSELIEIGVLQLLFAHFLDLQGHRLITSASTTRPFN